MTVLLNATTEQMGILERREDIVISGAPPCLHFKVLVCYQNKVVASFTCYNLVDREDGTYIWRVTDYAKCEPKELSEFRYACDNDCTNCKYFEKIEMGAWEHYFEENACLNIITDAPEIFCVIKED